MAVPSLSREGNRCVCCSEAEAAAWISEVAEAALDGDEDMIRLLPDVCDHYLGYSIVHLPLGTDLRRLVELLGGEEVDGV